MQTFLPSPDHAETARVLDDLRIGNQVYREAKTLYTGGWPNHPAARMWVGHEWHLADYALVLAVELARRSRYKPETAHKWVAYWAAERSRQSRTPQPSWLGNDALHASHRAALLFKDHHHYSQFGWHESPTGPDEDGRWPYVWPDDLDQDS